MLNKNRCMKYAFHLLIGLALCCELVKATEIGLKKVRTEYLKRNFSTYKHIHTRATDSLEHWRRNQLSISLQYYEDFIQIDSCMFFNKDSTKVFSCMLS